MRAVFINSFRKHRRAIYIYICYLVPRRINTSLKFPLTTFLYFKIFCINILRDINIFFDYIYYVLFFNIFFSIDGIIDNVLYFPIFVRFFTIRLRKSEYNNHMENKEREVICPTFEQCSKECNSDPIVFQFHFRDRYIINWELLRVYIRYCWVSLFSISVRESIPIASRNHLRVCIFKFYIARAR